MIKKGVSLLMALALCLTLLPASTLAAEAQGQAGQEQTVLTQGNDGQTQAPGQDGAGEDDKTSDEAPDKAPDKAPDEEPDEAVSAVQALIDALPAAEDISDANADEVSGQLDAIDEAKQALTEEQAARLDLTGYDAAAAAVLALAGEPDASEPALLAAIAGTQPGGSGTAKDPYQITCAAELIWLRDAVNAGEASTCAELRQDVEYVDEVWTSIGTSEHPYTGTFNGNGHTIRVWLDGWGQALFGYVGANAKLTDIAVTKRQSENYSISASAPLARSNAGTITRCRYSGGITAKDSLGGLVYTNSGTIEACCVYAGRLNRGSRIEMYYGGRAGGIAYENTGTIANSYFYGDMVQAQSGGTVRDIIGWGAIAYEKSGGKIINCYYGADSDDGYGGKTEDQFRGGEVAYLLNGGTARDDWRQNCYAGDNSDATPVLDRSHAQVRKSGSSYVSLYPHVHCICGGDAVSGGHPQHSNVTYTAWTNDEAASQYGDSSHTAANSLPKDPGYYYLTTSVTLSDSDTWRPADGTVLCLNGRTVNEFAFYKPDFDAITVDSGVTFSLTECASIQGYIYCASSRAVHTVNNSGTFNMYNGRLRGTTSTADGAAVYNNGTFNMYGGTISNNGTSARGGGVYNASVCNLYGGLITNNGSGGGVYNNGTLTVGGTATVTGGSPNVYLAAGKTITLNSELDESARIGITAEKQSSLTDTAAAITVVEGGAASLVCFFPDDDGTYDLSFNDDDDVLLHLIRDHTHCACGHKGKYARSIGDHTEHMDREFVAWTDELVKEQYGSGTTYKAADTLPKAAGYYYLTSDVDLGAYPWAPKDGTILCLNGHKITGSWSTAVRIDSNAHIVLTDCRASGSIRNTNTSGAALKSSGSSISRNGIADIFRISLSGTSVGVENYTSNTVNLYNSTVSGTRSAIYNTGTVNIAGTVKAASDAVDSGRYCVNNLGTLTVDGTLTADGGNIGVANRVEDSRSGTITVNGTLICTGDSDGLSNRGTATVAGTLTATGKRNDGVYNYGGTLTVNGTLTATGNASGRQTDGLDNSNNGTVTINGTLTASGGQFSVYNYGTLNLSGTVNATKNVFLGTGRTITVVGELDDATSIPIQTAATPEAGSPVVIATTENADWIKAGSFVSWTPDKYAVSRIDEGKTVVLRGHEHDWSYTLGSDGTAISAECGNADGLCGNPNGGSVTIAPPSGELIYDGSAKAARLTKTGWTAADVGEITYQKDGSALSAAPVDAGTYTAGITVGGQTASVTYTIRQAVPQAGDFAFSPPDTLTYDGSTKTAAVAARAGVAGMGGVTVKYYRNGVKVEQPADVGTYNVRIDVAEGKNYDAAADLTDDSWTFTIHRAAYGDRTVNGSAMYDNNGTVDLSSLIAEGGTAVLGSVTDDAGVLAGTCSVSEGILRFGFADDASKVGKTAKVKVNVTGADNYEDYTITVILTVEAKLTPSPEGALTLSPAEITYGEKLGAIAISGTMQADGRTVAGTFTWQEPDTVLDAGTHAGAAWKFTPDDTKTYEAVTGTVAVQVNRAAQSAAVSMADYTYNDAPSMPSLTYQVGDGSAVYYYGTENAASGGTKWEDVQPTTLDAGTYYMYAVIGETDNYKEFTTAAVRFVVEKAAPDYTKPSGLTAKYGQRLGDIQLVNPEGNLAGTWSWQAPETVLEQLGTQSFDADFRPDSDNYKGVVDAAIDVTVGPADGRNLRTVELVQKYTDTEKHTYAPDWSSLPEGQRWTFNSEASEVLPRRDFAADGSLLTYAIPEGKALGDQITITLKASCANYEDFTITLHILLREKDDQAALRVTGGTTVVYGEKLQLGSSGGSGTGKVAYAVTNGTGEAVIDPDTGVLTPVKVGIVTVSVTKAEDKDYKEAVSDAVIVTITKARPTGQPNYTKIITRGKTLDDAALTLADSTISPADGVLEWVDDAGNVLPGSTRVKANTAYKWRFTPADGNYTTLSGEIELYYKPNGGSQYGTDHTIRASAGANGTISPAGWTSVGEGGEQTFTITPDAGYAVAKVLVDGRSVGAVTSYTFRNVTQDHTIEAVFMKANGNPQTGVTVTRSTTGCGR
mgnify:CR=1 FL=1